LNDGSRLQFDIRDFIQVNGPLNQQMITTALDWLELRANDRVLDLFCAVGRSGCFVRYQLLVFAAFLPVLLAVLLAAICRGAADVVVA